MNKTECNQNLKTLLHPVVDLAKDAGHRIMTFYQQDFEVKNKTDDSPVTSADIAAHQAIEAGLSILTPELSMISEEGKTFPYAERKSWTCYWLVDPLDGTRQFVRGNSEFSVNIALILQNKAVLGVIYAPVSGVCYYACKAGPAYKLSKDNAEEIIKVRDINKTTVVVNSKRTYDNDKYRQFLNAIGDIEFLAMGSSLKSCLIAEGKADIYPRFGKTSEWDTAASQCILEQAGGQITDKMMQPLRYNTKASLINPEFIAFGDKNRDWRALLG